MWFRASKRYDHCTTASRMSLSWLSLGIAVTYIQPLGAATPRLLGRQLPPPPRGGQELVVKGAGLRSPWAPKTPKGNWCSLCSPTLSYPSPSPTAPTVEACRSMPQHLILGPVGGGFEACRSMPQHTENWAQTKILLPSFSICAVENDGTLVDRCSGCGLQAPSSSPRAVTTMSYKQRQQGSRLTYVSPLFVPFLWCCALTGPCYLHFLF